MKNPTIINGMQTEGRHQYKYTGLQLGNTQYRIYEDREGWFVSGEYTAVPPRGKSASRIRQAYTQAGIPAFREHMNGNLEKWKLKELAGI